MEEVGAVCVLCVFCVLCYCHSRCACDWLLWCDPHPARHFIVRRPRLLHDRDTRRHLSPALELAGSRLVVLVGF